MPRYGQQQPPPACSCCRRLSGSGSSAARTVVVRGVCDVVGQVLERALARVDSLAAEAEERQHGQPPIPHLGIASNVQT